MKLAVFLLLVLVGLLSVLHVDAKSKPATATGRLLCNINGWNYPIRYVTVRLKDKDPGIDDTFGSTKSSAVGSFSVSGSAGDLFGNPDPYIQVEYEYSGTYGKLEVENSFGINRKDETPTRSYSRNLNFGTITFTGDSCRAYVYTLDAMIDFRKKTSGRALPYNMLKVVTKAIVHGGTPFATTNKIRIPKGYNYEFTTAKHELAHTVRQSLEGGFGHFLRDVIKYKYMQNHNCDKRTNNGFAFNEGWAEFWAGTCFGTYGSSPTDYNYEGNVAKALRGLMRRCHVSYNQMVEVLARNPGGIHSFANYQAAYSRLYRCR